MDKQRKKETSCGKAGCNSNVGFKSYFCEEHEYQRYAPVFHRGGISVSSDNDNSYTETI